jgi:L-ascorbate metabolism protein UlaG (beta-lactamase superfamily)
MRYVKAAAVKGLLALALSAQAHGEVTVTTLANQGVVVSDGTTRVMLDGLVVEPYALYGGLPEDGVRMFRNLEGPFADIDLVLVSHRHHEHNQPSFACEFMQDSADARLVTSAQVIGLMREKCRDFMTNSTRVRTIDPRPGRVVRLERGGARVTVFPLSHGKRKYARIQHFGHLVELGGVTLLHVGDAALDPTAFKGSVLQDAAIDVALIPYRFFEPGPGSAIVKAFMDAPLKIAVHIPPEERDEIAAWLAETDPDVRVPEGPFAVYRVTAPAEQP